jgi:LysR family transcriptional regulator, glycine cleavage system transcriptional activator
MQVPFRAISVFHAVARSRSVSKAAIELGVTPSAVSQQVHALEEHLGSVLMMKVGSRIKLTSAGEQFTTADARVKLARLYPQFL